MALHHLTERQKREYRDDGYLLIESLFKPDEIELLREASQLDGTLRQKAAGVDDGLGGRTLLTGWFDLGDDLFSLVARSERLVEPIEELIGHEVYHYHSKVVFKEPHTGGAWRWHQDYGYWYNAGYLYPAMLSCMIAIDPCTRENGCLQVLRGSNRMGRIDHDLTGEQTGAEHARMDLALREFSLVHCEMKPGDALFFDANTLHSSDKNHSAKPRMTLICCYTATFNLPHNEPQHPGYKPLLKVGEEAIRNCGNLSLASHAAYLAKDVETYVKHKQEA